MLSFIKKSVLRLLAVLLPIAIIELVMSSISKEDAIWFQIVSTVGIFVIAIILALLINWLAKRIPYDDADKGK